MQKITAFAKRPCYASDKAKIQAKVLLVMRISVFCCAMLLASLQLLASTIGRAQDIKETTVKFGVKSSSLDNALKKLEAQSGIHLFYLSDKVAGYNISVNEQTRTVESILKLLLSDTNLDFKEQNGVVVIFPKSAGDTAASESVTISGKVIDEKGQPIPGVNIRLKGTSLGWTTNAAGDFVALVQSTGVMQFSFIGYVSREVTVEQLKKQSVVVLKDDISSLNEVQVIGYGTTTKRANTGDVTTIDSKTIAKYPTTNVLDVLQGTVPGLNVYKNSGNPGSSYKVQVRGMNGLLAGPPLYVIDGVPYKGGGVTTANLTLGTNAANGSTTGGGGGGYDALGALNPEDIESISVLKDADATAIYGSRGADGVILITTKKGKAGAMRMNATVYSGFNEVGHFQPLLNREQYLQMRREAKKNDNAAILPTDYDINGVWDTTRYTDWQKVLIGGVGHSTNAQIGVSGGSEDVQYRINSGYNYVNSLEHLGGSDQTGSLNMNLISSSHNKKFTASLSGGYVYDVNTLPPTDLTGSTLLAPDAPPLYTASGDWNFQNRTFNNLCWPKMPSIVRPAIRLHPA